MAWFTFYRDGSPVIQLQQNTANDYSPTEASRPDPTPESIDVKVKRAIVQHEIPAQENDVLQDMGSFSLQATISGRMRKTNKDLLDGMATGVQISAPNYTSGRMGIAYRDDDNKGTDYTTGLAIRDYGDVYIGGLKKWYRYTVTMVAGLSLA